VEESTGVKVVSNRWKLDGWPEPPNDSVVGTPERYPRSIRRSAHINVTWPGGDGAPMLLRGRARDLLTPGSGEPHELALDEMAMEVDEQTIASLVVHPHRAGAETLVGRSSSRRFRSSLDAALSDEKEAGTPLYFMLDDIAILSRIGGIAWSQHRPPVLPAEEDSEALNEVRERIRNGPALCSGLRAGGYNDISFDRKIAWPHHFRIAGDLDNPRDPWSWHDLDPAPEVCFRRRRRIDVRRDPNTIEVDAHYRDSVWGDKHTELSLHEYSLQSTIDPQTLSLLSVTVTPRVLPFPECPAASQHATNLVGMGVDEFRETVANTLRGLECCTHLNDMLRGLAEVPTLVQMLDLSDAG
jgi:hypothetical protein